jgi:hypothetical protein
MQGAMIMLYDILRHILSATCFILAWLTRICQQKQHPLSASKQWEKKAIGRKSGHQRKVSFGELTKEDKAYLYHARKRRERQFMINCLKEFPRNAYSLLKDVYDDLLRDFTEKRIERHFNYYEEEGDDDAYTLVPVPFLSYHNSGGSR